MTKQVVKTIVWTVIVFLILAAYKGIVAGSDNWLEETLYWVIPSAIGYFFGYGQAHRDENW